MLRRNEILAIADFLGHGMTDKQSQQLMDMARQLSIADREYLYNSIECSSSPLYTELSMHNAEMGGLNRY